MPIRDRVFMQVTEILDNAIDEVQAGHATTVQVCLHTLDSEASRIDFVMVPHVCRAHPMMLSIWSAL